MNFATKLKNHLVLKFYREFLLVLHFMDPILYEISGKADLGSFKGDAKSKCGRKPNFNSDLVKIVEINFFAVCP